MIVAGVMSGTSLDGIDVALVDLRVQRGRLRVTPVAFESTPYPKVVREALLGVSNTMTHTATIARLHFLLGELYADAVLQIARGAKVELIGMHGQTIFHEGQPVEYLGRRVASTLQIGEAAVVAERTGIRTISNFRERDVAAGGQGAPLVPFIDYLLFASARHSRAALNIGGIANVTLLPKGARAENVIAFDTGPGNMVMDALVQHVTEGKQQYDRNGTIARRGAIHDKLLTAMLSDPYFTMLPPKSTGRERFGREFVSGLLATGVPVEDLIATATEFSARSIALAIPPGVELIASGGGVHNRWLMRRLAAALPTNVTLTTSDEFGIEPDAKEAIAFAVLAYEFASGRCGNLPSATGAARSVLLGKDSPAC
jgi:anhydro-N-acetylmuramic acid kinase